MSKNLDKAIRTCDLLSYNEVFNEREKINAESAKKMMELVKKCKKDYKQAVKTGNKEAERDLRRVFIAFFPGEAFKLGIL